ncbi:uncharacterized protein [Periplaneta americana]|uniref:uncharacterized protein n=1 Tax=Periplaneta americana TaxID=6978 RepID=UPI0037E836AF
MRRVLRQLCAPKQKDTGTNTDATNEQVDTGTNTDATNEQVCSNCEQKPEEETEASEIGEYLKKRLNKLPLIETCLMEKDLLTKVADKRLEVETRRLTPTKGPGPGRSAASSPKKKGQKKKGN